MAWLNIALKEQGINSAGILARANNHRPQPCPTNNNLSNHNQKNSPVRIEQSNNSSTQPNDNRVPSIVEAQDNQHSKTLRINQSQAKMSPASSATEKSIAKNYSSTAPVSAKEVAQMVTELEQLIYRVESALITAEAKDFRYKAPMSQLAAQMLNTKSNNPTNKTNLRFQNTKTHKAIASAKQLVQEFPQLVIQDYPQARQKWLDARRNLWDGYPLDRRFAQSEIRAMWLDRGTIVKARSKAELALVFDRMAESGINTVFFETINASYPVYPSRIAPEQNPMTRGWDPLQAAVELAHERGMELHAWAWIFAAANQGHNEILNQPKNYLGPVLSRYPNWVLKDQSGNVFNRTPGFKKAFFDPAHPEVRRYLLALLEEIATNYDVDGIQLDYIRYPFQDRTTRQHFGYTDVSRHLFKQSYGVDPSKISRSSPAWRHWTAFRIKQVDSFVAEASQKLKRKRPNLIISTAVFPMERQQRLKTLQQNWEEWIYSEWVDMMVLMTYALHTGSFQERTQPVYDYSAKATSLIIPGIRLLNVPDAETVDQMQLLRNMPTGGFALFAAENLDPSLQGIFKKTQGISSNLKEPIPHRKPFASASARYQSLQQEWNFLLVNHQIMIDPRYLKEWSRYADALRNRLEKISN